MVLILTCQAEDESSVQRLEDAQRGVAEANWPKKPDNRLSPLSGKMKEISKISMRYYGQEKEFRAKPAERWQQEARIGQKPDWEAAEGQNWREARWDQGGGVLATAAKNEKFQPGAEFASQPTMKFREVEQESMTGWSSRLARTAGGRDGSLKMYEGRLTRVREQVWHEEQAPRHLGPGRQEKFSPTEVEKMLSQPVGELRGAAREQSPAASPLAAADN